MRERIDLLLVNPGNAEEQYGKEIKKHIAIAQPLGPAMVAAYVRQYGFKVAMIDAQAENLGPEEVLKMIEDFYDPMVVGLSAFTTKMTAAGKIMRLIKKEMPHIKTLAGGHHPSCLPEKTLMEEGADFVLKGEGYEAVAALLRALKDNKDYFFVGGIWRMHDGKVLDGGQAMGMDSLDSLPFAAWDLMPMGKYRAHHWQGWDYGFDTSGFAVIYTSLGCPFTCDYCSVNAVYGKEQGKSPVRYRSAESVVEEIKLLVNRYGVRHLEIIDDTFTIHRKHVLRLCDEIVKNNLGDKVNVWCFSRTDRTDPELLKAMKAAGINWVFIGFESGSDTVLQGVHKKQTVDGIMKSVERVNSAGIYLGGNYVFGLPDDTMESMQETLALAKEINTPYANFFMMMPYPGTKFYDLALTKGYPLPKRWSQYGFFAPDALPLRNDVLSSEDILSFRDRAFIEYYENKRYVSGLRERFGEEVVSFLLKEILSKKLTRISSAR